MYSFVYLSRTIKCSNCFFFVLDIDEVNVPLIVGLSITFGLLFIVVIVLVFLSIVKKL